MLRVGANKIPSFTRSSIISPSRKYAKVRKSEVVTGFDNVWRTMNDEQKSKLIKEYSAYETQDWHTLTLEQKRAIYTIAYGAPEVTDPYEGYKVFFGVLAVLATGVGVFAFARSRANPPPKTLSPEYQRAQEEYLRRQNCNPIFGISSKDQSLSADTIEI